MRTLGLFTLILLGACAGSDDDKPDDTGIDTGGDDTAADVDADQDGVVAGIDCDDDDPQNYPGNVEVCDGQDNDCDELVDDEDPDVDTTGATTWYADGDDDGFGDTELGPACDAPDDAVDTSGDCDDDDPTVYPGATEVCDEQDNDCDELVDDDDPDVDVSTQTTFYLDDDGDGFGTLASLFLACDGGEDAVTQPGDCNDVLPAGADINPDADEIVADGIDQDCDGTEICYGDGDGDGFGTPTEVPSTALTCDAPGVAPRTGDCDDLAIGVNPDADEFVADGIDQDCDQLELCYVDADGDGAGADATVTSSSLSCDADGIAASAGDCDDDDVFNYTGNTEICDGQDNDCDELVDDEDDDTDLTTGVQVFTDRDTDGVGAGAGFLACAEGPGTSLVSGDCDDDDILNFPGNLEVCDGQDNDCDELVDDDDLDTPPWWNPAWPYRVLVDVTAGPEDGLNQAPVAVDVDFRAALDAVNDLSELEPGSVRVVYQSCDRGTPELPVEFIDTVSTVFDKAPMFDPRGDEAGAVTFLVDRDGDYDTREFLGPNQSNRFGIYFGSAATTPGVTAPPAATTTLVTEVDGVVGELSNAYNQTLLSAGQGGITTGVFPPGKPNVAAQNTTLIGNGMYLQNADGTLGGWAVTRDGSATLSLIHDGPVFGAIRGSGVASNAYGSFDYTYAFFLFEGRPEVYVKVLYQLAEDSFVGADPGTNFWGTGVRPYLANNNAIATAALSEGGAQTSTFLWARGTYAAGSPEPYGVAIGWRSSVALRSRPIFDGSTAPTPGRLVGLAGQDVTDVFTNGQTSYDGLAGDRIVDFSILAVYPHLGTFGSIAGDFEGSLAGVTTVLSPVDSSL